MSDIIAYLTVHWTDILTAITSLIGAFAIIAKLTPTTVDDTIINFLLKIINLGALNIKPAAKLEATKEMVEAGVAKPAEAADAVSGVTTNQVIKAVK